MMNRKQGRLTRIRREGLDIVAGYLVYTGQISMLQRFPRLAKSFSPRLRTVFIEPTNQCNLRCKMCYRGARKTGCMDYDLFTRLIDEVAALGNVNLILHLGGESLMHPKFLDMLEYAMGKRDRLRRVGFFTNGTLLGDKAQEKLVKLGVDWISISLDGIGKVNEEIRVGSNYREIEANIRGLLEKRGRNLKPEVSLAITDTGQNIDEVVTAWLDSVDFIRACASFNSKLQVNQEFFSGYETESSARCLSPCTNMVILWNGDVASCCSNINGLDLLGNVADKSILDVWKGAKYRQLRHDLLTGKPRGLCSTCNTWKIRFKTHTEDRGTHQVFFYDIMKQYARH